MRSPLGRLGVLFLLSTTACGGCEEKLLPVADATVPQDTGAAFPDAEPLPVPDAGFPPPPDAGFPDAAEPEARNLLFDGTSPVSVFYAASRDLRFILRTVSGAPVASETITLTTTGTVGTLASTSLLTDASGSGTVLFTAGASSGQVTVTASADRAQPVSVTILVGEDPSAGLIVDLRSTTRIPVVAAQAAVFIGPAGVVPSCASLEQGATPQVAPVSLPFAVVPGTRSIAGLGSGQVVTVLATGTATSGVVVAHGCTEGGRLNGGTDTTVVVTLEQDPSVLVGEYDALLSLDLGAALPAPYDGTVTLVTDVLSDPSGWAVYQTLRRVDLDAGTNFLTWTAPGETTARMATFDEVRGHPNTFNVWRIASGLLDNFLENRLGQTYIDVTNVGADIARVIREFEVGARLIVKTATTPDTLEITERWQAIVYTWQLSCPNGDLGCARRPVYFRGANARLAPAEMVYTTTVALASEPAPGETERFRLYAEDHVINVRYGAIILIALNQVVFPNLPPNVAGNSLGEVMGNLINCADVATSLASATGLPANIFEAICDRAVVAAATAIEDRVLRLDSDDGSSPGEKPGLTAGGEMFLEDRDHDLATERLTKLTMYAQWTDPNDPAASRDLTSPIEGFGRRAASECHGDSDCASPKVCAPIASYLEVRALETDCKRPVGPSLGTVACAGSRDCASGLCFDPGTGLSICYAACDDAAACVTGTCTATAAAMSLDAIRAGLGEARISACVP